MKKERTMEQAKQELKEAMELVMRNAKTPIKQEYQNSEVRVHTADIVQNDEKVFSGILIAYHKINGIDIRKYFITNCEVSLENYVEYRNRFIREN